MTRGAWLVLLGFLTSPALPEARAVDHSYEALDRVLDAHVFDGRVDYASLQVEYADEGSDFRRALRELGEGDEDDWSPDERLAYWINAYNAFTLQLIVDHYPIESRWYVKLLPFLRGALPENSILQIPGRWDAITFESVRGPTTLGAIEHEILRPEMKDPRIHFAIVCASIGCPRLPAAAFRPETVQEALDEVTRGFVHDPRQVRLEGADELEISKIFHWFREDFAAPPARAGSPDVSFERYGNHSGTVAWIDAYGPEPVRKALRGETLRIGSVPYDWRLNDVETALAR